MSAAAVVSTAVGALAMYLGSDDFSYGGRAHLDLDTWVGAEDSWTRTAMPGAAWATDELCGTDLPCVQAVRSDTLTMYRFEDRDDAVAAARGYAGEGHLSGSIVVRFEPDGLSAAERSEFSGYLDCINVGVAEGGLEC